MNFTNEQYYALNKIERWYRKYNRQIIEISGTIGTGIEEVVKKFLSNSGFENREVMYLTYDQKQVLEMAYKGYHTFFIDRIIYKYDRIVDIDTIPVINPSSTRIEAEWHQRDRKRVPVTYRLMVVFDSILLSEKVLNDLCKFGIPIILIKDPMLLPIHDSYTFIREPDVEIKEINPLLNKNPIVYISNKLLNNEKIEVGSYDRVNVVNKSKMNLYNLQFSDMIISPTEEVRHSINSIYRKKILKIPNSINIVGEKIIVDKNNYSEKLVNEDEENVKLYLHKGMVGRISRCYKHREITKYLNMDFQPDGYHESFTELYLDRHYLNNINIISRQVAPDIISYFQYAYCLTPSLARTSHWNNVVITTEMNELNDVTLQKRMLYTAITRARESVLMII